MVRSGSAVVGSPPLRDVRAIILDVAEQMFAEKGFFGTSIRDITRESGTRLGSVNYYFESKEALLDAVIKRRFKEVDDERIVRLEANMRSDKLVGGKIEGLVDAFVEPLLQRVVEHGAGWDCYVRLLAQVSAQRFWAASLIAPYYDHTALRFSDAVHSLYPDASEHSALYTYQFMVGTTLSMFAQNGRIEAISQGRYKSGDLRTIYEQMRVFIKLGIIGMMDAATGSTSDA